MSEYLPMEVVALILRRLPVETVVKCTAVCKAWYTLIHDPFFISTHLQAASLRDDLLLHRSLSHYYYLHRNSDDLEEVKQLSLPIDCGEYGTYTYVGTCNGLICLVLCKPHWEIILWNPSIHKHFILPRVPYPRVHDHFPSCLGFGFDASSEDYKVILIASTNDLEVCLFSLNKCSWIRLTEFSPKHFFSGLREQRQAVFVNGAFHWSGFLHYGVIRHVIIAFNLSTEEFHVMKYPTALGYIDPLISLIKYEDSIAVVTPNSDYFDPLMCWVMKEYNIDSSWVNVLRPIEEDGNSGFGKHLMDVFGVRKNGELLVKSSGGVVHLNELALLDLNCHQKEQQLKHLGFWTHHTHSSVVSFVESLVLFDKGEQDPEWQFE